MIALEVSEEDAGQRLDRYLAATVGSRSSAERLIEAGRVRIDGQARPKRHMVVAGERIEVDEPAAPSPSAATPASLPFGIAYEDEHLLVVDKPAGMVVHPARGHRAGTLAQALAGRVAGGEDPARSGIVHRLDRDTSGLLVVARSEAVHRDLKALIASREMRREYLELVEGHPPARSGTIDAPIGRDRSVRTRVSTDSAEPREARTHFELERALSAFSLLSVSLETGRTHQIRAHLLAIGHPVAGDPEYGTRGLLGLERQFLHATRLFFEHPVTGKGLEIASPLPSDLAAALARAEDPTWTNVR
ncbi:MAG: RluA family pseudouridine synthase [Solirubrobacteraceae bacterium]